MTAMTKCPVAGGKIPVLDQDPFSPESLENPLPFQEALREAGPVAYLSKYGAYAIGRYEHMSQAVSNWQELTSGEGVGLLPPNRARGLLQMDPPEHDTPREVLQEILSARVPRSMKDNCMLRAEALFDELLDGVPSGGEVLVDGVQQVGAVFPVNFFPDASGIDPDGREKLVPYADHIFNSLGPRNELFEKGAGQAKELNEWATGKCQRDALAPEGFGAEIWAAADRGDILHEHAPLLTRSLLSAGVDTTVYGISGLMHALATNPEQYEALKANPGLARVAFDESLRVVSPVQQIFRVASTDVEIEGFIIPKGSRVLLSFQSANHDPRRWENPTKFDLNRDPSGHLAFGMGMHQCVGQHAAGLQSASLLEVMLRRVATVELAGPVEYSHNNVLRGWGKVPLRFTLA